MLQQLLQPLTQKMEEQSKQLKKQKEANTQLLKMITTNTSGLKNLSKRIDGIENHIKSNGEDGFKYELAVMFKQMSDGSWKAPDPKSSQREAHVNYDEDMNEHDSLKIKNKIQNNYYDTMWKHNSSMFS